MKIRTQLLFAAAAAAAVIVTAPAGKVGSMLGGFAQITQAEELKPVTTEQPAWAPSETMVEDSRYTFRNRRCKGCDRGNGKILL